MPLGFIRYYRAGQSGSLGMGSIGKGWGHSYSYHLNITYEHTNVRGKLTHCGPSGGECYEWFEDSDDIFPVEIERRAPDGSTISGSVTPWQDYNFNSRKWTFRLDDGGVEVYSHNGTILTKHNPQGIGWTFTYISGGRLDRVTHSSGRYIQFTWNGQNIVGVTDSGGNYYSYGNNTVTYPSNTGTRTYHYGENGAASNLLTGISYNGIRYSNYLYNDGRVAESARADGSFSTTFEYHPQYTMVTNSKGARSKFIYEVESGIRNLKRVERSGVQSCPDATALTTYNSRGATLTQTDWNGGLTSYTYNQSGLISEKRVSNPNDSSLTRITQFSYIYQNGNKLANIKRFGASLSDPINETSFVYYPSNHAAKDLLQRITICNKSSIGILNQCQITNFSYIFHSNKLMSQMVVSGATGGTHSWSSRGYLTSSINAAGHTTTYSNHNSSGLPGRITDPNGLVKSLTYDARGRVIQEIITGSGAARTNSFEYGPFGLIKKSINGVTEYTDYSNNGSVSGIAKGTATSRLISKSFNRTTDGDVSSISFYTGSVLQHYRSYVRDALGRVLSEDGNSGQSKGFQWDNNGNLIAERDSLNRYSYHEYDVHNQRVSTTNPINAYIQSLYDATGNVKKIIDGKNKSTSYEVDGLGNYVKISSPESGVSNFIYDNAGRVTKMTRANSVSTSYTYDSLNRMTSATSGSGSDAQSQTWAYDNCTNGKGKLCSAYNSTMGSGSGNNTTPITVAFTYNKDGSLSTQTTSIQGVTSYSTSWSYDANGHISSITYPSGNRVAYEYDNLGRVNAVKVTIGGTQKILASNINYYSYGPIANWTYGNGTTRTMTYDLDYRLTHIHSGLFQTIRYTYDSNNNITNYTYGPYRTDYLSYNYDELSRLTSINGYTTNKSYSYDMNGNRLTALTSYGINNYVTAVGTDRLVTITGTSPSSFQYSSIGNIISTPRSGSYTVYRYDLFNRKYAVSAGGTTNTYWYNGLNQRVRKTGSKNVNYAYTPDGFLLSETNNNSLAFNREYIWLNGNLIGLIHNGELYYVHTDHIGRPNVVSSTNNIVVWQAFDEPFERNVSINQIGDLNIGYPGQYYDSESDLWYNWHRFFDAKTGRYTQSDPIGLAGGMNTYAYAGNNPVNFFDFTGLQYGTPEEAAIAGLCEAYPHSYAENAEYGGRIIKTDNGFDFTQAITQGHHSKIEIPFQARVTKTEKSFLGLPYTETTYSLADNTVGWYHTHSRPSKSHDHLSYSSPDANINKQFNIPGWYTDGNGVVRSGTTAGRPGKEVGCKCSR